MQIRKKKYEREIGRNIVQKRIGNKCRREMRRNIVQIGRNKKVLNS